MDRRQFIKSLAAVAGLAVLSPLSLITGGRSAVVEASTLAAPTTPLDPHLIKPYGVCVSYHAYLSRCELDYAYMQGTQWTPAQLSKLLSQRRGKTMVWRRYSKFYNKDREWTGTIATDVKET